MTYRDFEIPKKNGFRKISAPSPALLRAQRDLMPDLNMALNVISTQYNVSEIIHGFRYNHNCITAAQKHIGYETTLMMDISNFFNSINRKHFMYYDITIPNICFHKQGYTAQGFATSPILANIAIIPALREIKDMISQYTDDFAFTIYADDIQISTNMPDVEFQIKVLSIQVTEILKKYGLEINNHKTRIAYAKYGYRRILGVNVGKTEVTATRKIRRRIRAARHQQNGPSLGGLITWSQCRLPRHT